MGSRSRNTGHQAGHHAGHHAGRHAPSAIAAVTMLALAATLAACGGSDDNGSTGSNNGTGNNGGTGTTPAAVQPLSGGSLYVGAVSFGDTVSVALDQPAAGQLTLRFLDSRFGLAGTLVGQYTVEGNMYRVSKLAAVGSDVPAALAAAAASITFSFTLDDGLLSGALGQVPNVLAGNGALLQGYVSAANRGAQLADVVGTYSYLRQAGDTATAGQLAIDASGAVRVCAGQGYAATCAGGQVGQLSADADQTRYPGAYTLTLAGSKVGRVFVGRQQGNVALFVDETGASTSAATGNWVVRPATALAANGVDGDWLCSEPELDDANVATGRTRRNIVSVAGNTLAADNIPVDVALSYNSVGGATANGLLSGNWQETVVSQSQSGSLTWLPVSRNLAYQLRQVPGSSRQLPAVCAPLAAPAPIATYLQAAAGQNILVTMADLRPTQPAIGRDQIYYKLGRYAAEPLKNFDDACENNGQNKTAKNGTTAASRIDDLSTFTCTKAVGEKPEDMKTLVVGPFGEPYLTDGHHAFSTVTEAPTGGPQAKMWVRVQDNLSGLNRAQFFRTLRERKLVWLKDGENRPVYPADLPRGVGLNNGLGNDPYRSLVYFTRDIGYAPPTGATEYTEFYWGDWLRTKVDLKQVNLDDTAAYLAAVRTASEAMVALAPEAIVSGDKTAATLGRLSAFGEAEFTKLSQPVGSASPGKLPYAVDYRLKLKQ
ncbi:ParB/Srx family N-terminal domain-containing protein [Cupriavidus sp. SW-Y-13]|uniref:ParB/Srx family N-terminal domain-containing protein n=1 Tax=Cupriavidus sp. SW-Y-13 TaxID=2653854 RepID=UPI001F21A030|nr:ParB/Srx family N-terminal domain-containing protein [Cupriavidus sp. SW-Y-13]